MLYCYIGAQLNNDGQNKKTGRVECWCLRYRLQAMMIPEVGECNGNAHRPKDIGTIVDSFPPL